jgi:phosphatidylglycerol---prolipoprotein diacylglyceryl transferase
MHPVLIRLGSFSIYTYGFLIAVGFVLGILLARKEAEKVGIEPDLIMDLSFYIIISAIIGSRLFYVMTMPETFFKNPLEIFKIWNGGLVFYGGFILALITALIVIVKRKAPLWKTTDIFAPSIAIGQFFGRLGCFSAGCCYGKICDLPWAVKFHNPESLAPIGIALHPSQLYHALGNLLIFLILWGMKSKKKFHGQVFWTYVALDGGVRCFLEIFRGDFRGQIFLNVFSLSQVIGSLMVLMGVAMLTLLKRKNA